jgi:hypothetical protein
MALQGQQESRENAKAPRSAKIQNRAGRDVTKTKAAKVVSESQAVASVDQKKTTKTKPDLSLASQPKRALRSREPVVKPLLEEE